jgi:hypothetical protein
MTFVPSAYRTFGGDRTRDKQMTMSGMFPDAFVPVNRR